MTSKQQSQQQNAIRKSVTEATQIPTQCF